MKLDLPPKSQKMGAAMETCLQGSTRPTDWFWAGGGVTAWTKRSI